MVRREGGGEGDGEDEGDDKRARGGWTYKIRLKKK